MPKHTSSASTRNAITAKLAPDDPDRSLLLTGLATLAEVLQQEANALQARGVGGPGASGASQGQRRGEPGIPQDADQEQLEDLQTFIYRIRQIYEWLKQDTRLIPIVDDAIGKRVRELEAKQEVAITRQNRQNYTLAIVTTIAGALLGWLISLLSTPASLFHILVR